MRMKNLLLHKFNIFRVIVVTCIALIALINISAWQSQHKFFDANGEIVVIFNQDISDVNLKLLLQQYGDKVTLVRHIEDYALLSVKDSRQYQSVLESIQRNPQVSAAQENDSVSLLSFSNDTYAGTQWAIENPGYYTYLSEIGQSQREAVEDVDMDVQEAWEALSEMETTGHEVVVAVVDTGVDYSHPDLINSMWVNEEEISGDNTDNDNNGYVDDVYGWDFYNNDSSVCHYIYSNKYKKYLANPDDNDDHGTHVAGIIGATANNSIGIAGIASNVDVKIMSLKINGGKDARGSISGAIEAIKYATKMGADICNLSWGTTQYSATLEQVMKESDMLFVAAAGNTGSNNDDNPIYPACLNLDNLIAVTFINAEGELTDLSNYGTDTVDLAAPGEDIFSTIVGSYAIMTGSSMAAPQVTGIAALLYSGSDHLYAVNVKELIMRNRKELPGLENYIKVGGIPSAYNAVVDSSNLIPDTYAPTIKFETIYNMGDMLVPVFVEDQGDSHIRVVKWLFGIKTAKDFGRGTNGTTVEGNQIIVSKSGPYTFYAADYAGNETVKTYDIQEDITAPKLTAAYTVANNYKSRSITVKVSDKQSGIKRVKYMSGKKTAEEFLPADAGTQIELTDGIATFKVKKDGTYTIFASDYRGNLKTITIVIKTVKATGIKFASTKKTVSVGEKFTLRAFVKPVDTTDRITYTSSDESIITVTSKGTVKALAEGNAYITAKTSSGLKVVCKITVNPKSIATSE